LWAVVTTLGVIMLFSTPDDREVAPFLLLGAAGLWLLSLFSASAAVTDENRRNGHAG
jgi:hypothetical protein